MDEAGFSVEEGEPDDDATIEDFLSSADLNLEPDLSDLDAAIDE